MSERLRDLFQSKVFRDEFVSAGVDDGLALQIFLLRDKRKWSQSDLGQATGDAQPGVSRWERPGHDFRLSTLKKIASAFDVALVVRFVPFSDIARWSVGLGPGGLEVPTFDEDAWPEERRRPATTAISAISWKSTSPETNTWPMRVRLGGAQIHA